MIIHAYFMKGGRFTDEIGLWLWWPVCVILMVGLDGMVDGLCLVIRMVLISTLQVSIEIHDCYYY